MAMGICPRCGWYKHQSKCKYCGINMIETDIDINDSIKMSHKEEQEIIKYYLDTYAKDTFDPEIQKWRIEQEKIDDAKFQREYAEYKERMSGSGAKCPSCGSTNVSKISTVNRAFSVGLFGLASSKIGKTHKCNNCGTTW